MRTTTKRSRHRRRSRRETARCSRRCSSNSDSRSAHAALHVWRVARKRAVFRPKNAKKVIAHRSVRRYIATARPQGLITERRIHPHMAAGPMTKSQLINYIAENAEVPRKTAVAMLEALSEVAYKEAKKGFTLPGLGK